ncbi:uncharacterized protein PAC_09366 [Phialocephala subalpina]|uniref:AAA+ ATPase domain-containing protein n=1 Tax=Phialocephala subalpina TaxID=576137 RepID=A0A1L7X376_9HELO|nr:uncharacterized protein PAC_09366 [Phialocephala subalpina]
MEENFEALYEKYQKGRKNAESNDETPRYNSEFEDVTQLANSWGSVGDVFRTSEKQSRDNNGRKRLLEGKFSDVSLLLRRTFHWDLSNGETWTMKLEIQSTVLRQAFREFAKGFTSISLEQVPIVIEEPFADLYFCRDRIQKAIEGASSDELKKELELLETFRKTYMEKTITTIETSLAEGMIKADDLWSLFPIGSEIILQNGDLPGRTMIWCVLVKSCFEANKQKHGNESSVWKVTAKFNSFNGKQFRYVERSFSIGGYHGAREIRSLPAYPLDLHPEKEKLRQSLIDRGKRYVELCIGESRKTTNAGQGSHRSHSGPFWEISTNSYRSHSINFFSKPTREHDGRLVVDPAGKILEDSRFHETIVDSQDENEGRHSFLPESSGLGGVLGADEDPELTGANLQARDLLTAPATVAAYSLSFKEWGLIEIESIRPVVWQEGAYDMLQMDPEKKEVVRGVIESHHASSTAFDDFIPGKGRGLVFLLYGPPGCGKTMTAESAAETLHRPLYYISGAELGLLDNLNYQSISIEEKLGRIFKRIARWEAILLFDEADTFVASRGGRDHDGKRNALTSILLRMLEYQSGIIFLTTNRITDFDKALFSRVHVTLQFEQLLPSQRRFIWENMTRQTDCDFSESDFERLSQIPLDGRTIKNILRVASLHAKMRERNTKTSYLKMGIADIKAVLRLAVVDPENEDFAQKVQEFYNESRVGMGNLT